MATVLTDHLRNVAALCAEHADPQENPVDGVRVQVLRALADLAEGRDSIGNDPVAVFLGDTEAVAALCESIVTRTRGLDWEDRLSRAYHLAATEAMALTDSDD